MRFSVSIKGVIFVEPGQCVLALNDRDEWELPGGRIELGETPEQCLAREISEELGLEVAVSRLLDCYLFEVIPDAYVFIVTYGCVLRSEYRPRLSEEHLRIQVFTTRELPHNLPTGYKNSILAWGSTPN